MRRRMEPSRVMQENGFKWAQTPWKINRENKRKKEDRVKRLTLQWKGRVCWVTLWALWKRSAEAGEDTWSPEHVLNTMVRINGKDDSLKCHAALLWCSLSQVNDSCVERTSCQTRIWKMGGAFSAFFQILLKLTDGVKILRNAKRDEQMPVKKHNWTFYYY